MMGWLKLEDQDESESVFLVSFLWFVFLFGCSVLFQFVCIFIYYILLLLIKCLFSNKRQQGGRSGLRESREKLEGVGEEIIIRIYCMKKKYVVKLPIKLVF